MATRQALDQQLARAETELEAAKDANHRLRGVLKALCLNNGGAIDVPIAYLEQYCADAGCALEMSPTPGHIRARVTSPTPAEAGAPHVDQEPGQLPAADPPRPLLLGPDGRPLGDVGPRIRQVLPNERVHADGRITTESNGFVADVVDSVPGMPGF